MNPNNIPTFSQAAATLRLSGSDAFKVGNRVKCWHSEYGELIWTVIGIDCEKLPCEPRPHIVVMCDEIVAWRQFSEPSKQYPWGNNDLLGSNIRKWLKGDFMGGLDASDQDAVGEVLKITHDRDGLLNETLERFFLLSCSEVGFKSMRWAEVQDDGPVYEYFKDASPDPDIIEPLRQRLDRDGDEAGWWLRSPYPSNAYYVRHCTPAGELSNNFANSGFGADPACAIY